MTALLIAAREVVSVLILACVGLAFLPHSAARALTGLQEFLTNAIERART